MALTPRTKVLITLAAPVVGLGALELGLRLFGFTFQSPEVPVVIWTEGHDRSLRSGEALHVAHAECLWSPRPGAAVPVRAEGASPDLINADGCRGPRIDPRAPGLRVALLGESNLFGIGLPYEDTCGAQLQALLGDEAQVFSASVMGYTVHQGRARYRAVVRDLEPDVVVVAFGFLNESNPAPDGSDPVRMTGSRWRASVAGRALGWARSHTRVGQLAELWRVDRAGGVDALVERAREAHERRERLARIRLRELSSSFGAEDWPGTRRSSEQEYSACLTELLREIAADGARAIVVQLAGHPDGLAARPVLERYREINAAVARAEDASFLDLPQLLAGSQPDGRPLIQALLREGDFWHLGAAGNRVLAGLLRDCVLERDAELAGSRSPPDLTAAQRR